MSKEKGKKVTALPNTFINQTVSPSTKLLQKRRKMYQIHQAFEVQKEQHGKDEDQFKKVEQDIRKRDLDIQFQLNELKQKKLAEKLTLQRNLYQQRKQQLQKLEQQCKQLTQNQKKFETRVNSLRKYQDYLEKVRSTYSDQYPQMSEILNRYNVLKSNNNDVMKKLESVQGEHETLKIKALNYQKNKNQLILQLSNQTKQLARKLEEKNNQRNQLMLDVDASNELASQKDLNLSKILMAIDNLHFRCNEGNQRLKQDYQQFKIQMKNQIKKPNKQEEKKLGKKDKKDEKQPEDELTYEVKCKIAAQKLKSIFAFMKDFKNILDEYRKQKLNRK